MEDKKNFLIYYEKYKDKIFTYFWYRVGFCRHVAEDLTSDVFMKALKNFDSFDDKRSFQAWIYAIAKNHLSDHYHKMGREVEIECAGDVLSESAGEITSRIDNKEEARKVIANINRLSGYHREVLIMRYVDGLSNQEIRDILGKEEGAVRAQISRALQELRKRLRAVVK